MANSEPRSPMTFSDLRLLVDKSVSAWIDDYAPSMGAAIAYPAAYYFITKYRRTGHTPQAAPLPPHNPVG